MLESLQNIDVRDLIPQKHPFVMVDRLIDFSTDKLTASLLIKSDNLLVQNDYFSEPGLIEHMAQSVALHTGCEYSIKKLPAPTGYIGAIKSVTINKLPKVGTQIQTEVTILQEFMGITLVNITVFSNNEPIATSEMKTVIAQD